MGKAKHINKDPMRHKTSLTYDIESVRTAKASMRIKSRLQKEEKLDPQYVDASQSKKILELALEQKAELEKEENKETKDEEFEDAPQDEAIPMGESEESINMEDELEKLMNEADFSAIELTEEESKALELFNPPTKEELYQTMNKLFADSQKEAVNQELLNYYRDVGKVLAHFRSGKGPKGLPPLPRQRHWKHFIQAMKPDKWTAAAMSQVALHHISSLPDIPKGKRLCEFLQYILLPRVRDDILEFKKLNGYLFLTLIKAATFKPMSFYKGIILALVQSENCSQHEARILAKLLFHKSINPEASFVALIKLAELPHCPASGIFMHALLAKKYRLKQRVLLEVIKHFTRSVEDKKTKFHVLWHTCLLVLCKGYGYAMTPDLRDSIRELVAVHSHYSITPEILAALNCSGEH